MRSYNRYGDYGGGFFGYDSGTTFLVVVVVLAVISLGVVGCRSYLKEDSVVVHVTGKESVNTHDGHEYRIYTEEGTFVMKDSLFKTRFRTGDEYGRIKPDHVYRCNKFGWRIPVFSSFENLLKCREVTEIQ